MSHPLQILTAVDELLYHSFPMTPTGNEHVASLGMQIDPKLVIMST
jgi:hypothetical protein